MIQALSDKESRENQALEYFFSPRNIAVIGASNKAGKMGNIFIRHLLNGFTGKIFPVHPTERKIVGLHTYPDVASIPEKLDLVIPLVPNQALFNLVKNCTRGQVKFLLAIPSGFGEVPAGGKHLEQELIRLATEREIRIVGPNTAGMMNCMQGLNASMLPEMPAGGAGFSCVTQSGGFGMATYMYAIDHQLAMAKFCDLGNTADVSEDEILHYFAHDTDTRIVGVFLESVADRTAFFDQAEALAKVKPLILTSRGQTEAGSRAAMAHIGKATIGTKIQENRRPSRIIRAQTGLEMLHIAKGLSWQPLPRGRKVAIITGSGGIGVELVDLCVEYGLKIPKFSPQLQNALRPYLPAYAGVENPVDLTPIWWDFPKVYPPLIQTLFSSEEIDLLIVTVIDIATTLQELMHAIVETVTTSCGDVASKKPIYVYWASPESKLPNMRILERAQIPCYQSTLSTARTAAAICRYAMQSGTKGI
jgi:acyl-CoA synthetase (NDP forming)